MKEFNALKANILALFAKDSYSDNPGEDTEYLLAEYEHDTGRRIVFWEMASLIFSAYNAGFRRGLK